MRIASPSDKNLIDPDPDYFPDPEPELDIER